MKPLPALRTLVALSVALLLPLEQAHCGWMGVQKPAALAAVAAAATTTAAHACCAPVSAAQPTPEQSPAKAPQACICEQLPLGSLPSILGSGANAPTVASIAMLIVPAVIAPVSIVTATVPALDVGSPPLPADPGAHGLRAPPVSA